MAVQIPFPLPSTGYALNSKIRVNLDFLVDKFNEFNSGTATWDTVAIGTANSLTGTLTFYNVSNAYYLTFQPATTATGNVTYTLPPTLPSANPSFMYSDTSGVMKWKQFLGTTNQVSIANNSNDLTFSLPQSIDTGATVTFATITGTNRVSGTQVTFGNGTAANPGLTLSSENTGFYRYASNVLGVAVNGAATEVVFGASGIGYGTGGNPSYPFDARGSGDSDTIIAVRNTFATSTTGHATFLASVRGTANDPRLMLEYGSGAGEIWYVAADNSDSNKFVIGNSATVGSGKILTSTSNLITLEQDVELATGQYLELKGGSSGYVRLTPAGTIASYNFTFPTSGGSAGHYLKTDGSGGTSWDSPGSTLLAADNTWTGLNTFQKTVTIEGSGTNGNFGLYVSNTNTGGSAAAYIHLLTPSTGADSFIRFDQGGSAINWALGRDVSDSAAFKISKSTGLGTNDYFNITTSGFVGINTTSVTDQLEVYRATTTEGLGLVLTNGEPGGYGSGIRLLSKRSDTNALVTAVQIQALGTAAWSAAASISSALIFKTVGANTLSERFRIDHLGNVIINTAAISTSATDGFLYVPSCAGTPTGVPTAYTGRVPIVVDTTNNKLYFYSNSAWRDAGP